MGEFGCLWKYILDWQQCFKVFDRDGSGAINITELEQALTTFGYSFSQEVYQLLVRKFDRTDRKFASMTSSSAAWCCRESLTCSGQRTRTRRGRSLSHMRVSSNYCSTLRFSDYIANMY